MNDGVGLRLRASWKWGDWLVFEGEVGGGRLDGRWDDGIMGNWGNR